MNNDKTLDLTMQDQETEQAIALAIKEIVETVHDLLKRRKIFPALVLLYSSLDIVGSLLRPKLNLDTSGDDFKNWVERYILKGSPLPATAEDLWAARCGLLHTNTPASRNSRKGVAKEVHYSKGDKKFADFCEQEFQKTGENRVMVDIDILFDAFLDGLIRFSNDIKSDKEVRELVLFHAKTMFAHSIFKTTNH